MAHPHNLGRPIASPHSHGTTAGQAGEMARSLMRVIKRIAPQPLRWYPLASQSGTLSDWNRHGRNTTPENLAQAIAFEDESPGAASQWVRSH